LYPNLGKTAKEANRKEDSQQEKVDRWKKRFG